MFREDSQQLFGLNTLSAFLWACLQDDPSVASATADMVQHLGLDENTAAQYTHQALEQWQALGLLGERPAPAPAQNDVQRYTNVDGIAPLANGGSDNQLQVQLRDCRIDICVDNAAHWPAIRSIVGHLQTTTNAKPNGRIDVRTNGDHYTVYRNRQPVAHFSDERAIAPTVKSVMLQEAIDHADYLFYFHAGVLRNQEALVLLPGAQGAGKSTLTAGLVHAGLTYYSDEVALLQPQCDGIRPFPIALCAKEPAWPVVQTLFQNFEQHPVHYRLDNKVVRYTPPPVDLANPDYDRALPVRHMVFPRYQANAKTELKPIGKVAALQRLMEECLAIKRTLTHQHIAALVSWIEEIDCYELPNSSLGEAVGTIKSLVG